MSDDRGPNWKGIYATLGFFGIVFLIYLAGPEIQKFLHFISHLFSRAGFGSIREIVAAAQLGGIFGAFGWVLNKIFKR